ncbi:unnamed protein product [Peronospora belbahrii]|uniref:Myb-like domain-containing protein n=1 Tax=Peronospora belbahrii TaxID=622444 RepID=A0AAU9KZU7_9STRA|nr:unnamed protein product [Peronospora belbahrii]
MKTVVELPKLRIPIEATRQPYKTGRSFDNTHRRGSAAVYYSTLPVFFKTKELLSVTEQLPHQPTMRSPSSPSTFFTQPETTKFGLAPLLEAAEQVRPSAAETLPPLYGHTRPHKREHTHTIPTIMHATACCSSDNLAVSKRARIDSDVDLDVQASNTLLGRMPLQSMIYPLATQQQLPPQVLYNQPNERYAFSCVSTTKAQSPKMASLQSPRAHELPIYSGASVWEVVLSTGKFPADVCLSENGSGGETSQIAMLNLCEIQSRSEDVTDTEINSEAKQDRSPPVNVKEHTPAIIRDIKKGEVVFPLSASIRKLAGNTRQRQTMRISKKSPSYFLSLRGPINQEHESTGFRDGSFNPLSLKSIMNYESNASPSSDVHVVAESIVQSNIIRQISSSRSVKSTKQPTQRMLKRSDYSQHGMVRSGRWSVEEENYAKAMIKAFKAGYLPLHGNVSLRKFLSEVLVCHPMRISKKFVGYVRKYHWYRIAAGTCDSKAKQQALYQLRHLERAFWTSLQQSRECPSGFHHDD